MTDAKPPYDLVLNKHYSKGDNQELHEMKKQELNKLESTVISLGKARGWGGNPRYDLILEEGLRAYLSGDVDKRKK